jgi:hypothetical protein
LTINLADGTTEKRTLMEPQHTLVDEVRRFVHLTAISEPADGDHDRTRADLLLVEEINRSSSALATRAMTS